MPSDPGGLEDGRKQLLQHPFTQGVKRPRTRTAQQVKVPATKTEHLRSVPGTHTLAGEHHSPRCGMGMRTAKGTQNDKRKKELE